MNANRKFKWLILVGLLAGLLAACAPGAPTQIAQSPMATQAPQATQAPALEGEFTVIPPAGQMIIKNADLELQVADTDAALDQVTFLAADHGGYIISSQTWFDGDYKHGTLNMGVPVLQFEAVLNRLRHVGVKVTRETTSGQDVSADYADLAARLTNLEATSTRVRDFLATATNVTESLTINAELSSLEGQIEQIKGQMRYYEGRSAFSTITVALTPERAPAKPAQDAPWQPGETFTSAVEVLKSASQTVADGAIWFTVVCGPGLLVLAALFAAFRFITRLRRAR